nr:hypothetical protein [Enterobacter hormaechei]
MVQVQPLTRYRSVVKDAANDDVYVDDGALSSEPTKDVTYFEQKNGAITNSTGGTIYETADGKLTTEATTASPLLPIH